MELGLDTKEEKRMVYEREGASFSINKEVTTTVSGGQTKCTVTEYCTTLVVRLPTRASGVRTNLMGKESFTMTNRALSTVLSTSQTSTK